MFWTEQITKIGFYFSWTGADGKKHSIDSDEEEEYEVISFIF